MLGCRWTLADGTRLLASALPNGFVTVHECLSGYTEGDASAYRAAKISTTAATTKCRTVGRDCIVRRGGLTETYDEARMRGLVDRWTDPARGHRPR